MIFGAALSFFASLVAGLPADAILAAICAAILETVLDMDFGFAAATELTLAIVFSGALPTSFDVILASGDAKARPAVLAVTLPVVGLVADLPLQCADLGIAHLPPGNGGKTSQGHASQQSSRNGQTQAERFDHGFQSSLRKR